MRERESFIYGVATSAFQIEGSPKADGRTPSIWDVFTHMEGKIYQGHTADSACEHYRYWEEDMERLTWLGVDAYRFSISWSRIFPEMHKVNQAGVRFYMNLVENLEARGIKPCVTIYHWDLPIWAQREGG